MRISYHISDKTKSNKNAIKKRNFRVKAKYENFSVRTRYNAAFLFNVQDFVILPKSYCDIVTFYNETHVVGTRCNK